MTPELLTSIRAHAAAEYPRESCGLLVLDGLLARYEPCRNIAPIENPDGKYPDFQIDPEYWARCEDSGKILGIVHSHPDGTTAPSALDQESCRVSGLPWWIVAGENWRRINPGIPLERRQFAWGVQDCFALVRDWWAGYGVELPDFVREPDFWKGGENPFVEHLQEAGFRVVHDDPQEGDGLLFGVESSIPNHAGVYVGQGRMLHHLPKRLSITEMLTGWWQERHVLTVRRCA